MARRHSPPCPLCARQAGWPFHGSIGRPLRVSGTEDQRLVLVGGEEGDMQLYFESLQRIIDLDPAAIVPSHGTVMGTTFRLRETLKHRRLREEQVLGLHRQGLGLDDMLERMYQGTPAALLPLARINIESHLGKLDREGRLSA